MRTTLPQDPSEWRKYNKVSNNCRDFATFCATNINLEILYTEILEEMRNVGSR